MRKENLTFFYNGFLFFFFNEESLNHRIKVNVKQTTVNMFVEEKNVYFLF